MRRQITICGTLFFAMLALGVLLLRADFPAFFRWYLTILLMGIGFYPLSAYLFDSFEDHGWLFSKVLAIATCGFVAWLFVTTGLQNFTSRRCIVITLIAFGICWVRYMEKTRRFAPRIDLMMTEELLFLGIFLLWTYLFAFRPEAHGTEKYMDYGLLVSMERSLHLPAKDMWYGLADVNYYYGGQYFAAYLSKLCYLPSKVTYHLMRGTVAAMTFTAPFSIVYHMLSSRLEGREKQFRLSVFGGILAGAAVSLAGNLHYVLYGLLGPVLKLSGYEDYWFPSSTRFIGHNPVVENDQCIHEFPSYSFVLGDLHAHMLNLIFVLTIVALLYAWARQVRVDELDQEEQQERKGLRRRPWKALSQRSWKTFFQKNGWEMQWIAAAALIGLCKWVNYWDFIIYFTLAMLMACMVALFRYRNDLSRVFASIVWHLFQLFLVSFVVPLPFTLSYEKPVSGIGICVNHTPLYQWLILWGLPLFAGVLLLWIVLRNYQGAYADLASNEKRHGRFFNFFRYAPQADRFALVLALSALGLACIPELVYVRDIYEEGFSRANTMFKLTYQAYVLFGMVLAYAIVRLLSEKRQYLRQGLGGFLLVVFLLTVGYFPYSVSCWFGDVTDSAEYRGLDATAFLEETYPEDAGAIRWLDEYVKEQPLVLEASGSSYTDDCRVSAMTGLPTLMGWYVHEWLWRGDTTDLNAKNDDIQKIYEAEDPNAAGALLHRYGITYLFVGSVERSKYVINDDVLRRLGEVVYEEGTTYVIKIV